MRQILAFFDRNYNRLFNNKKCIKVNFHEDEFEYQDILFDGKEYFRYLGKGWLVKKVLI